MSDTKSIASLRIYQASRTTEDAVYELVKGLPDTEFYRLGNDLRRSSAAVSHYLTECHRRYSYSIKLEALHLARTEAEVLKKLLADHEALGYGPTGKLQDACTGIIKQSWGLIKYIKQRQNERQATARAKASDELVAARA